MGMSLAVWLGEDRKFSAAVVGLGFVLGLSMARRCSLEFPSIVSSLSDCAKEREGVCKQYLGLHVISNAQYLSSCYC